MPDSLNTAFHSLASLYTFLVNVVNLLVALSKALNSQGRTLFLSCKKSTMGGMVDSDNTQNLAFLVWRGVLPLDQLDKDRIVECLKGRDPINPKRQYP